jgi:hypothetical protein
MRAVLPTTPLENYPHFVDKRGKIVDKLLYIEGKNVCVDQSWSVIRYLAPSPPTFRVGQVGKAH